MCIIASWSFVIDKDHNISFQQGNFCYMFSILFDENCCTRYLFQKRLLISVTSEINQFVHSKYFLANMHFVFCIFINFYVQIREGDDNAFFTPS